ncbi:hypothetical protein LPB90_10560 [Chryseobacterium sp. LC2016-29]|uniref:ABC-three component system middle component 1 n=1 Tax=Chryseobacterium sp. LC2016-29 TaxID=2897331 RepID=UPI001E431E9C|nr:ABC-three component system middle component 1 [Chryseobacterium sp. LC2016-29]MCD0478901.1 hypothetical protein [Chryseobacterium sp. LC2016-29]
MSHKELFNKIELEITAEINSAFELNYFSIGKVHYGGEIIVCIVKFNNDANLVNNWKEFNSYLTAKFITTIKDDYSKWNFYIFYFSENIVGKAIKYEIENNKFSSRKIVIENSKSITTELVEEVINEHITNSNIEIYVENKQTSIFKKNNSIAEILDNMSLGKKNDDDLQVALDLIEKNYNNEI